jgi:CSLREA domain-containing protein
MKALRMVLIGLLTAAVVLLLPEGRPVHAATITVNTTADVVAVDGACTLREAIDNANDDAATHPDCVPGSGADTIAFSVSGTITLNGNHLPIVYPGSTIVIQGASAITIDAAGQSNHFLVFGGNLTLNGLTLQNGAVIDEPGGAITSNGEVTISDSTLSGNRAILANPGPGIPAVGGAIFNAGGHASLSNVTLSGNSAAAGGAISNSEWGGLAGTMVISRSVLRDNSADGAAILDGMDGGGAIQTGGPPWSVVGGELTISDSILEENTSSGSDGGGAILNVGVGVLDVSGSTFRGNTAAHEGGAILVAGEAQADVLNSTLSGNATGNAAGGTVRVDDEGSLTFTNVTLWDAQGGGLVSEDGTTTAVNSIVFACSGTIGGANNLALTGSGCPTPGFTLADDLLLGPLQNNGGPTETHALLEGSPAIDAGSPDCPPPATDQRGG